MACAMFTLTGPKMSFVDVFLRKIVSLLILFHDQSLQLRAGYHLRPVEFSVEFFTVLEHERHANLSLVRFRQERGAASTFHKVVDMLELFMRQRNFVVEDPVRSKKMTKILDNVP
jgi:Fungal kinase associated-1 domain